MRSSDKIPAQNQSSFSPAPNQHALPCVLLLNVREEMEGRVCWEGGSFLPFHQQEALKGRSLSVLNQKQHRQIYSARKNLGLPPKVHDVELAAVGKEPAAPLDILSKGSFLCKREVFCVAPTPQLPKGPTSAPWEGVKMPQPKALQNQGKQGW